MQMRYILNQGSGKDNIPGLCELMLTLVIIAFFSKY